MTVVLHLTGYCIKDMLMVLLLKKKLNRSTTSDHSPTETTCCKRGSFVWECSFECGQATSISLLSVLTCDVVTQLCEATSAIDIGVLVTFRCSLPLPSVEF